MGQIAVQFLTTNYNIPLKKLMIKSLIIYNSQQSVSKFMAIVKMLINSYKSIKIATVNFIILNLIYNFRAN